MKCWYKCPVSLSFEVSFTFTTALHVTWLTNFLHNLPYETSCTFTTTLHVTWLTHFLRRCPYEKSCTFTTTLHVTWLTHFLHRYPYEKSCTFTTTFHVTWQTYFLHKHPHEKSCTFTTTLHVIWLTHFLLKHPHEKSCTFPIYNITCDMADTFSAFFKVQLMFPHYHENLLLFSDTIIIITLKKGINIIYTSGRYVQPKCALQLLLDAWCTLLSITGVITTTVMDRILSNNN